MLGPVGRNAAALVVGNELLTGKIADENTPYLARTLFELGIALRRVIVCPDEIDVIASDLNALRATHEHVFTSGGVGPTHDDITLDAVAHAFGVELIRSVEMAEMIRAHFGERTTDEHLRMANLPRGSRLVRSGALFWPTIAIENVFVLPGVPAIYRSKLDALRPQIDQGERFASVAVFTRCDEGEVAALLARVAREHPAVSIGSYIGAPASDYDVKLTFDGPDPIAVDRAANALLAALDRSLFVRREG
jgi:molybdenum cofactor synthesis domain-containing protein